MSEQPDMEPGATRTPPALPPLMETVRAQKAGKALGMGSICSANRYVLEAAMLQAARDATPVLIESTSNQVNQFGGYIGMTPPQFVQFVREVADDMRFPFERVILGGDHLGPHVWQTEDAKTAMGKARDLVADCVAAGYTKIHLDPSMRLGGDAGDKHTPLADEIVAERAAELCQAAEAGRGRLPAESPAPVYIVGTEVPIPGGSQAEEAQGPTVTRADDASRTMDLMKKAFLARGLDSAWERVIGFVVQPGVEFGDASVYEYDRIAARGLSRWVEKQDHLVFEAHSTDYQPKQALRRMVEDHFAILKVGPWLTFAFREAVFCLADMESEWVSGRKGIVLSDLRATLDKAMRDNPAHWKKYHVGDEAFQAFARKYSYSDRSRYYWPVEDVQRALSRLLSNMANHPAPLSLLSQYMPEQYEKVREGVLANTPRELIHDRILKVTGIFSYACGTGR